jgi:glycosyltransferase involved in cell wall biosynthesis
MAPQLSLIIPAHNEERRLPSTLAQIHKYVIANCLDMEVLVVDNGSIDNTSGVVHCVARTFPRLQLVTTDRAGKGLAVRVGVSRAQGQIILFGDADLSWPLPELIRFPTLLSDATPVVIGSREGEGAHREAEPAHRHLMGRAFNYLTQALLVPGISDTQCGFKAFKAEAACAIFDRQTIDGFGFDVEVLYLARQLGYQVRQVPLQWQHRPHSQVQPARDGLRMFGEVLSIRLNSWAGRYQDRTARPAVHSALVADRPVP